MNPDLAPPTGNEFEQFTELLGAFLEGWLAALGLHSAAGYCQGDFFGERTEAIHFQDPKILTPAMVIALEQWLSAPRWRDWRIVVPSHDDLVIYAMADGD